MSILLSNFFGMIVLHEVKNLYMLKIKELREEAQMTQKQLAEKISNMQRNISNWEKGVSEPDLATVLAIADVFNVTLDELFGREERVPIKDDIEIKLQHLIGRLSSTQKSALYEMLQSFEI